MKMKKTIFVKIKPGSNENKVIKDEIDFITNQFRVLTIKTTSKPENGEANKSIIEILSKYLSVSKMQIKITSGLSSREKKIEYED
jgi:uncharacterized protein YggU (UPF0235/DUF167 family)